MSNYPVLEAFAFARATKGGTSYYIAAWKDESGVHFTG